MTKSKHTIIPAHIAERAATRYEKIGGHRLTTYAPGSRNPLIGWSEQGKVKTAAVARAAWVHHHGKQPPTGKIVRASCGDPRCIDRLHLMLTTRAEQMTSRTQRQSRNGLGRFQ